MCESFLAQYPLVLSFFNFYSFDLFIQFMISDISFAWYKYLYKSLFIYRGCSKYRSQEFEPGLGKILVKFCFLFLTNSSRCSLKSSLCLALIFESFSTQCRSIPSYQFFDYDYSPKSPLFALVSVLFNELALCKFIQLTLRADCYLFFWLSSFFPYAYC